MLIALKQERKSAPGEPHAPRRPQARHGNHVSGSHGEEMERA